MIRETLDNRNFRIVFAILVGVPATLIYFLAAPYGIMFGIGAFSEFHSLSAALGLSAAFGLSGLSAAFGIAAVLGTFGVIGAWLRLLKCSEIISQSQLRFIRISLICGTIASLILMGIAIWLAILFKEGYLMFGLPFFLLAGLGVVFYVGT